MRSVSFGAADCEEDRDPNNDLSVQANRDVDLTLFLLHFFALFLFCQHIHRFILACMHSHFIIRIYVRIGGGGEQKKKDPFPIKKYPRKINHERQGGRDCEKERFLD